MAVVTIMDSNIANDKQPETPNNETSSVTNMLPAFSNPFSSSNEQTTQPAKEEGNMFSGMFNSDNNADQPPAAETSTNNGFNPFGDVANSDEGLAKETPPVVNPFQQPVQEQPAQGQPPMFGGKKYNKTNKHKSKHNKKTKNHRKK
jgi:hypothetical protein